MVSAIATQALSFAVQLTSNYLLSRVMAQNGPRLDDRSAGGGDYGVGMPRLFGEKWRVTGVHIGQGDFVETKHTVEDYSEIVGAIGGAAQGFMIGGPVGAAVGAVVGFLFGAAAPDQKYYTYDASFGLLLADRFGDDPIEALLKLSAQGKLVFNSAESTVLAQLLDGDGELIWRKYKGNRHCKSVTVYGGHRTQPVDPVLADRLAETSGHPYSAYAVIEKFQVDPFGRAVPQDIEALVQVRTGQTVADAIEIIAGEAGIDPIRNLSTTAVAGDLLLGMGLTSETSCWDAVKPLLPVFAADAGEVAGQIRLYKRSQTLRGTIPAADMGAHAFGDDPPPLVSFRRDTDLSLPQETALTWIDPDRDYLPNSATARRSEGDAASNVTVSIPVVLTASQGATAAELMHWDAWLGRVAASWVLTDKWNGLAVGYAYAVPFAGQYLPFRVARDTRGANGLIEVEALSDERVTYAADAAGTSGTVPDEEPTGFADTRVVLIDGPITEDVHDDYGFYAVVAGSEAWWQVGRLDVSGDGGATFVRLLFVSDGAVVGDVTGTLPAGTTDGLDDTLDTTSVLTVVLLHDGMELASATDAQLDAWANFAYVGKDGLGEYLQYKTATKVAPATWQLTNLRRGRKGTDWAIGEHAGGEEFALLGGPGVRRIIYTDDSAWGDPLTFRGVTLNQDEDDAAEVDFANSGEGKRPYSPVEVTGVWDGSNNLTISWTARSRLNAGGLGIDDQDNYEVEIVTGAGRVITATGVESAAYSAADQVSDGITPGDSISGRVRQLSDVNNGRWRDFTLVGPNATLFDSTSVKFDETSVTWDAG